MSSTSSSHPQTITVLWQLRKKTRTTPPKKQIKDFSQDFYSAGFIPGAILFFLWGTYMHCDISELIFIKPYWSFADDAAISSPYLNEEIMSLKDVEAIIKIHGEPSSEPVTTVPVDQNPRRRRRRRPQSLSGLKCD
ncbi:unnamed protein product [Brassica oleracea]